MIKVRNLSHQFKVGKKGKEKIVPVLQEINLDVERGEIVTIKGRSGSGKSTLLNLLSGYIHPTEGEIHINGQNVTHLSEGDWSTFRLQHMGFIFQSFQLIPSMTAYENIELPLILKGVKEAERVELTQKMLVKVGLEDYQQHYPSELSGGQQQRVSIARALIVNPPLILADEPTGSLDSENETELLQFIKDLNKDLNITFLIITHDDQVANIGNRIIEVKDGELVKEAAQ